MTSFIHWSIVIQLSLSIITSPLFNTSVFAPCGGRTWLFTSVAAHVKHPISYRMTSYRATIVPETWICYLCLKTHRSPSLSWKDGAFRDLGALGLQNVDFISHLLISRFYRNGSMTFYTGVAAEDEDENIRQQQPNDCSWDLHSATNTDLVTNTRCMVTLLTTETINRDHVTCTFCHTS